MSGTRGFQPGSRDAARVASPPSAACGLAAPQPGRLRAYTLALALSACGRTTLETVPVAVDDPPDAGGCVTASKRACYGGAVATRHVGACADGWETCGTDGQWEPDCEGSVHPAPESCNGMDDDCDGETDVGAAGSAEPCETGLPGACAAGATDCLKGQLACVQQASAAGESCNGLDDDCDGETDVGAAGSAEPDVDERTAKASRVHERRVDEHVESLREPRLTVTGDGVTPDPQEPHATGDQR